MINLFNSTTGKEQIDVLSNMFVLLDIFDTNPKIQLIMARDFNFFFDSKLECTWWKSYHKEEIFN